MGTKIPLSSKYFQYPVKYLKKKSKSMHEKHFLVENVLYSISEKGIIVCIIEKDKYSHILHRSIKLKNMQTFY